MLFYERLGAVVAAAVVGAACGPRGTAPRRAPPCVRAPSRDCAPADAGGALPRPRTRPAAHRYPLSFHLSPDSTYRFHLASNLWCACAVCFSFLFPFLSRCCDRSFFSPRGFSSVLCNFFLYRSVYAFPRMFVKMFRLCVDVLM